VAERPDDPPLTEEAGKAWVLDALEALDEASFVFVMASIGALTRALLLQEPRPETYELAEAIAVYLSVKDR
jgi:hypothetical protein